MSYSESSSCWCWTEELPVRTHSSRPNWTSPTPRELHKIPTLRTRSSQWKSWYWVPIPGNSPDPGWGASFSVSALLLLFGFPAVLEVAASLVAQPRGSFGCSSSLFFWRNFLSVRQESPDFYRVANSVAAQSERPYSLPDSANYSL